LDHTDPKEIITQL